MTGLGPRGGQRVVAVTGGGGGIGAAIAHELGRRGDFVITMDPMVSLDGTEQLPAPAETTAGRIVAAGGSARATSVSVTDGDGVRELFEELGRIDAVVNVAGISRPTSFTRGSERDWRDVLEVHLGGYVNVLRAALPMMEAQGSGQVLGVTSGSGWRAADAGAYSCAKRAVAALTWQLGRVAPPGVTVNAISPIAVTRMVTAALGRAPASAKGSSATGGLSLGSMPEPEELAPLAAHLVHESMAWCRGQVLFAGGPEVAVIERPRLIEVLPTEGVGHLGAVLDAVVPAAFGSAEVHQATNGGGNPRYTDAFRVGASARVDRASTLRCAVAAEHPELGGAVQRALAARGITAHAVPMGGSFDAAEAALAAVSEALGALDAVVVVPSGPRASGGGTAQLLDEHAELVDGLVGDASWARAVAARAERVAAPTRLVTVIDAVPSAGKSRAQADSQLARAARRATEDRVAAFAVSVESKQTDDLAAAAELTAHLVGHPDAPDLSGAELVVGPGWLGLRSHPRPGPAVTLHGSAIPDWLDGVLAEAVGTTEVQRL